MEENWTTFKEVQTSFKKSDKRVIEKLMKEDQEIRHIKQYLSILHYYFKGR